MVLSRSTLISRMFISVLAGVFVSTSSSVEAMDGPCEWTKSVKECLLCCVRSSESSEDIALGGGDGTGGASASHGESNTAVRLDPESECVECNSTGDFGRMSPPSPPPPQKLQESTVESSPLLNRFGGSRGWCCRRFNRAQRSCPLLSRFSLSSNQPNPNTSLTKRQKPKSFLDIFLPPVPRQPLEHFLLFDDPVLRILGQTSRQVHEIVKVNLLRRNAIIDRAQAKLTTIINKSEKTGDSKTLGPFGIDEILHKLLSDEFNIYSSSPRIYLGSENKYGLFRSVVAPVLLPYIYTKPYMIGDRFSTRVLHAQRILYDLGRFQKHGISMKTLWGELFGPVIDYRYCGTVKGYIKRKRFENHGIPQFGIEPESKPWLCYLGMNVFCCDAEI